MKIGILTQPLINNYGGFLQNYALQKVLKDNGHEVITLDWNPKNSRLFIRILSAIKTSLLILLGKKREYHYRLSDSEEKIINYNFNKFAEINISKTPKSKRVKDLRQWMLYERCEALIVGSDQCWRPSYCNGFETAMFLDFAENYQIRKIAYAASFGTDTWEYNYKQTCTIKRLINTFSFISVRESNGVEICSNYLGVKPIHVLDPTMLLHIDDYMKFVNVSKIRNSALFYYILDPSPCKTLLIDKLAKENKLQKFTVLPKYQSEIRTKSNVRDHIDDCVFPAIESWISAFYEAELVVVDSFHGCVFSIIFNKPFWVIGNAHRGMSRFTSLLSKFQLDERLITEENLGSIDTHKSIDWVKVNSILEKERQYCLEMLYSQLN